MLLRGSYQPRPGVNQPAIFTKLFRRAAMPAHWQRANLRALIVGTWRHAKELLYAEVSLSLSIRRSPRVAGSIGTAMAMLTAVASERTLHD